MALKLPDDGNVLGVDYGGSRTGLAVAGATARLPSPYGTAATKNAISEIKKAIKAEGITLVAVGLPKSLAGSETAQSKQIRHFAAELEKAIDTKVVLADETLSSVRAKQYIKDNKLPPEKVDSIAACFILEGLLGEHGSLAQEE
jgi:putative Holliday junction resolvase